jgi:glycosyltransferase involved in cell wall biosynthesis
MAQKKPSSVAILMCTYNGELYLKEQLDSIQNQDDQNWTLYVSDDGSTDQTLPILKSYQALWGIDKLHILKGPRQGFQKNFISLITSKKIHADFYMLCDQDDVWLPQKITAAITYLETQDQTRPQLYCGRTSYVNKKLKFIEYSELFLRPRSFHNAIVQSIAGGNTMAFNNPYGDKIVTGSFDRTAKIWDANTGQRYHTLKGHKMEIVCLGFDPHGMLVATGSMDHTAKLWDVETGQEIFNLSGHRAEIVSLCFNTDGDKLLTASFDNTAKAKSGNERSALANMVTDAVANRGRKMKGFRDAAVEGLKPNVNVGRGPTKGNKA